jgi:hypothetical protein
MATAQRTATATLHRIGISRRVSIACERLFAGEFTEDERTGLWTGRIWLAEDESIGAGRGMVIWEISSPICNFCEIVHDWRRIFWRLLDVEVKLDTRIEASTYYSAELLEAYPYLAGDMYLAACVYDERFESIVPMNPIGKVPLIDFRLSGISPRVHCNVMESYIEWQKSRSDDRGYLAWLASEELKRQGNRTQAIARMTR